MADTLQFSTVRSKIIGTQLPPESSALTQTPITELPGSKRGRCFSGWGLWLGQREEKRGISFISE